MVLVAATRALLSRARPGWAHPKAALSLDFFGNRAWRAGAGVLPIPSAVATVRASDAWQKDTGGVYQKFGPNELPCLPGVGAAIHAQYTQYFADPAAPATQTVPLAAGTYTCRVAGAGSVTLSGAASGVAIDGAPVKFTLASSGNVTCTVAGNPACVNLTNTAYPAPMHLATGTRLGSDVRAIASGSEPFAGWNAAGLDAGFSVLAEVALSHVGDGALRMIAGTGTTGTAVNRVSLYIGGGGPIAMAVTDAGGSDVVSIASGAEAVGSFRVALRAVAGDYRIKRTGAAAGTSSNAATIPAAPLLFIGQRPAGTGHFNDTIERIEICRPLTDTEMDAWVAA